MTPSTQTFRSLTVITALALALSGTAFAGGTHAGGHGHGGDETAIGKPGVASKAGRTVTIEMTDNMRYTPAAIQVKQGETVRFVVRNKGQVKHEMSLGTEKELLEHLRRNTKILNTLRDTNVLDDDTEAALEKEVDKFTKSFRSGKGGVKAGTEEFDAMADSDVEQAKIVKPRKRK